MLLVGLPLWNQVAVRFGGVAWIVFPLLALVASLGLMAAFVVVLSVYAIIRNLRLRFEKPSLALARKSAGEDGTIERSGPVTTWWCGTTDPVPTLMEQMGISHERFERLIDESVETPPLRVLVFDTRDAWVAYHRGLLVDTGEFDSVYLGRARAARSRSRRKPRTSACTIKRDRCGQLLCCIILKRINESCSPVGFRWGSVVR